MQLSPQAETPCIIRSFAHPSWALWLAGPTSTRRILSSSIVLSSNSISAAAFCQFGFFFFLFFSFCGEAFFYLLLISLGGGSLPPLSVLVSTAQRPNTHSWPPVSCLSPPPESLIIASMILVRALFLKDALVCWLLIVTMRASCRSNTGKFTKAWSADGSGERGAVVPVLGEGPVRTPPDRVVLRAGASGPTRARLRGGHRSASPGA